MPPELLKTEADNCDAQSGLSPATCSASYVKCHCGNDCVNLGDNPNEPCWGKVVPTDVVETDDDDIWIHHCAGHEPTQDIPSKPYRAETPNEKS